MINRFCVCMFISFFSSLFLLYLVCLNTVGKWTEQIKAEKIKKSVDIENFIRKTCKTYNKDSKERRLVDFNLPILLWIAFFIFFYIYIYI